MFELCMTVFDEDKSDEAFHAPAESGSCKTFGVDTGNVLALH